MSPYVLAVTVRISTHLGAAVNLLDIYFLDGIVSKSVSLPRMILSYAVWTVQINTQSC